MAIMATVYPNYKEGKIISFKLKAFLGRDENGKQIFKCKTWIPDKKATESKLTQLAQKQAIIWEQQAIEEYEEQKKAMSPSHITFEDFVKNIWMPAKINEKELRPTTIAFHTYILKIIIPLLV